MSEDIFQEETTREAPPSLASKPQRSSRQGLPSLLFVVGGVVMLGVVIIIAWSAVSQHVASTPGTASGAGNPTTKGGSIPGAGDPEIYWQTIKDQVAQGMHVSLAELQRQLRAGSSINEIAAQQGLSSAQLRTLELNAIQAACQQLVSQGSLTQQEADQRLHSIQSWSQDDLEGYVMEAILNR